MHHLNSMKIIGVVLVMFLTVSCSSREFTLEQYAEERVKFAKQKVKYPNNDFTIFIPENWDWKIEGYNSDNIILGIDASSPPDKRGFIDLISVQKAESFGNTKNLKSEFEYIIDSNKDHSTSMKVIESGETKILKQKAYFIHTKSNTGDYGESEQISFILESDTDGVFYYLNAGASQTEDLKKNMAVLIHSLKTFETKTTK